ncbi:CheA signal transduction histidine kinase [Solidesulfovibrio carbinoliphilus subsp. oakridgensis]|uniref:Chemotaxis protein CheA n=1 Tax=Solidesulfovibrio carbinoliphilus subsp. oakridgensis TaxID=694327 RepID=G7Q6C9_9BACT|nr:chemotaxis protein CheA [Solidesulfovibrio carbinoliphilus]EHJ47302.1 CheA signal transduction histidine kinase [Solidesulfovibrio carbinoliphilus subsp. oakridgensis]
MSQDFMDPELFADFIVEAREHLETIEPNLLELERNPGNLSLLNDIFRPMHSLKGASGFLGLNAINLLAHKAENILDELRKGNIAVSAEIMDVILAATDLLRMMIENLEQTGAEGDVDTSAVIARIAAQLGGGPAPAPQAPAMAGAGDFPAEDVPPPAEAAPAAPDPAPVAATEAVSDAVSPSGPHTGSDTGSDTARGAAAKIARLLEELPPFVPDTYPLTSIGEGHMADFLEEAREIIERLNAALLELESAGDGRTESINDIFRYFHNLKGNSGIIGHKELNGLTHEAETLLNRVRKGEIRTSPAMVDLLLAVVDQVEALVSQIEPATSVATPLDIRPLVARLKQATEDGEVAEPAAESRAGEEPEPERAPEPEPEPGPEPELEPEPEPQPEPAPGPAAGKVPPKAAASGYDPEDVAVFESTIAQQITYMTQALAGLVEDADSKDMVDGLFRALVTIQNSSGYMGLADLKTHAERTAGLVDQARKSGMSFEPFLDILRQECSILGDMIAAALDKLRAGQEAPAAAPAASLPPAATPTPPPAPEPAPAPPAEPEPKPAAPAKPEAKPTPKPEPRAEARPAPKAEPKAAPASAPAVQNNDVAGKPKVSATIRVDHEKLDHLMNLIGELLINRNRFAMLARSLEEGKNEVGYIAQQLTETTYAMARISDDLQDTIMKVRMVPVSTVFSRFPRLVRDLSRKSGKEVSLITDGEETELDKSVVEVIGDPLVHLIRNSVDHGIETEAERVAVGKPPVGRVWLRAYHRGNSVAIEIEDDGKGIDPAKMREVAVKKNLMTPEEAKSLDDRDAIDIIFMPGFSSAEKITDISGRGVGMDVVRTNIKNLKGTVSVTSEVGKGTKFTLALPLTLAIIDALMVVVAGQTYALPLDSVSETTKIEVRRMTEINRRKAVTLRGEVLGIVELAEVLDLPSTQGDEEIVPIVILQDNERRLGLIVDRLLERQEIVIKPLGAYLSEFDMRGISGATIMGDGSVVLILDPHEIYMMSTPGGRSKA